MDSDEEAPDADQCWNAGALSCGELVLLLRRRVLELATGEVLHLIAEDPAAPLDIRAWCRVTGHPLIYFRHPHYYIQRKVT